VDCWGDKKERLVIRDENVENDKGRKEEKLKMG